jgi:hypothetical protein
MWGETVISHENWHKNTLDILHDLGKAHGFVHTGDSKSEILHHGRDTASLIIRWLDKESKQEDRARLAFKTDDRLIFYATGSISSGLQFSIIS